MPASTYTCMHTQTGQKHDHPMGWRKQRNRQKQTELEQHTHTHTRLTALFPGLPGWAGTRKVKAVWILLKQETVSGSGISWAICKSASCSRQITMPVPHHSVFYRPDALPAAQPTASKHWRQKLETWTTQELHKIEGGFLIHVAAETELINYLVVLTLWHVLWHLEIRWRMVVLGVTVLTYNNSDDLSTGRWHGRGGGRPTRRWPRLVKPCHFLRGYLMPVVVRSATEARRPAATA